LDKQNKRAAGTHPGDKHFKAGLVTACLYVYLVCMSPSRYAHKSTNAQQWLRQGDHALDKPIFHRLVDDEKAHKNQKVRVAPIRIVMRPTQITAIKYLKR
jgi:hypothetical protein